MNEMARINPTLQPHLIFILNATLQMRVSPARKHGNKLKPGGYKFRKFSGECSGRVSSFFASNEAETPEILGCRIRLSARMGGRVPGIWSSVGLGLGSSGRPEFGASSTRWTGASRDIHQKVQA